MYDGLPKQTVYYVWWKW